MESKTKHKQAAAHITLFACKLPEDLFLQRPRAHLLLFLWLFGFCVFEDTELATLKWCLLPAGRGMAFGDRNEQD